MIATALPKPDVRRLEKIVEAIDGAKSTISGAELKIGEMLVEAQGIFSTAGCKGQFSDFVRERCGFSHSTAYRYIGIFKAFGNCPSVGRFELTAMYELAGDEESREAAIEFARKGNIVTAAKAREIIEEVHRPAPPVLDEFRPAAWVPPVDEAEETEEAEAEPECEPVAVATKLAEPNVYGELKSAIADDIGARMEPFEGQSHVDCLVADWLEQIAKDLRG